ncbi:transposase [Nitrosomonas sp.]|nr:transposase [Nitrosomonas sp.]
MVGVLILKQLENLSDKVLVMQWKRNQYYKLFAA